MDFKSIVVYLKVNFIKYYKLNSCNKIFSLVPNSETFLRLLSDTIGTIYKKTKEAEEPLLFS